ncbi:MAG: hypothetical protein V4498_01540 [candidate division FCPU426 bacterium]
MKTVVSVMALCLAATGAHAAEKASKKPTPSVVIDNPSDARIWMEGDRVLVSGSAMGYSDEAEARKRAIKDAAETAATFLEKRGFGKSREISNGVEQAVLRETKLRTFEIGDVKVENSYQERWNGDNNIDRYAVHLTLSIRLKPQTPKAK